ncbi:hypothetical protein KP509_19G048400 [Ceratopteris richardii]|uniref:VQ domain-containing protein n=1 Tax=Ceratopteris richardii TaxID=49495 RepID=A0A8T2SM52_CERRI|nr:hypothetical protein KP509_19G048400 [Ceratopteris richardii]
MMEKEQNDKGDGSDSERHGPRILKLVEPTVIRTDVAHFRSVVQSLTGKHCHSYSGESIEPGPFIPISSAPSSAQFFSESSKDQSNGSTQSLHMTMHRRPSDVEADSVVDMYITCWEDHELTVLPPLSPSQSENPP